MNNGIDKLARSYRLRVSAAAIAAALGLWAFAPYMVSEMGGEAQVNAPIIRMASPISGIVATDLPAPGTPLAKNIPVVLVRATNVDRSSLESLKGEAAALGAVRDLARKQIAELGHADHRLASRSSRFGTAAAAKFAATTVAAREGLAACEAEAAEAVLQRDRIEELAKHGFATFTQRDRLRAVAIATARRCAAMAGQVDAITIEARAASQGLYLSGTAMDAPYGDQQRDRMLLRRQELEIVAAEAAARFVQLQLQIGAEEQRVAKASSFRAILPAGTVVWSQPAPKGTVVSEGANIIEVADCRHRYVEVSLPERRMEAILPGERVQVRLIGSDQWLEGRIASTAGAAARGEGALAATSLAKDDRALTVMVVLPPPSTLAHRCDVGRLAEVRFPRW